MKNDDYRFLKIVSTAMEQMIEGELLQVEAVEVFLGNKIGIYDVRTTNEKEELVALFKGTAYRTSTKVS